MITKCSEKIDDKAPQVAELEESKEASTAAESASEDPQSRNSAYLTPEQIIE